VLQAGRQVRRVARQDTATAGRINNCQVGVFLAYASPVGYALVDRELYLPRCWTDDPARLAEAGVPDQVAFHPKPQLAQACSSARWRLGCRPGGSPQTLSTAVTGGCGSGWRSRRSPTCWRPERTEPLWTWTDRGPGQVPAERLLTQVPAEQWLRISAGQGSKGRRLYDWTRVALNRYGWPSNVGFWLGARRSIDDPKELAFYACFGRHRRRWSSWFESPESAGRSRWSFRN
jgi:hypothetical protein